MNFIKADNTGVDKAIEKLQRRLYDRMFLEAEGDFNGYGRVYKNTRGDTSVFEAYVGNNEYIDVTGDDDSNFFFYIEDQINITEDPQAVLNAIFLVDIDAFYQDTQIRKDEEFIELAYSALNQKPFTPTSIVRGIENIDVLLGGNFINDKTIRFQDMHPKLAFHIKGTVTYTYKNCT